VVPYLLQLAFIYCLLVQILFCVYEVIIHGYFEMVFCVFFTHSFSFLLPCGKGHWGRSSKRLQIPMVNSKFR